MTLTDRRKELIDKIMKLLAKAESTPFPQEADSARKMAADLMVKYDISIEEQKAETDNNFIECDYGEDNQYNRTLVLWIAKINSMCFYINTHTHPTGVKESTLKVVGKSSDLEAFQYMLSIVKNQREKALIKFYQKGNKPTNKNTIEFYIGFSLGLRTQIKAIIDARATIIQEQGLVLYDRIKAAERHIEEIKGAFSKAKNKKVGAFAAEGFEAGKTAKLNKGIDEATANGTLLLS